MDELDDLIRTLDQAPAEARRKAVQVFRRTGEKIAGTQRQRTRSSTTRDKITVRPSRRGSRGGMDPFSVWVGPSYTDPAEPNLSWIEEYGTATLPPHPFIEGSELPHMDGMVRGLTDALGDML